MALWWTHVHHLAVCCAFFRCNLLLCIALFVPVDQRFAKHRPVAQTTGEIERSPNQPKLKHVTSQI